MYRNRLEFSRWLRAYLRPKRSRVFDCPGFFGSASSFAHSGGQSVIHGRNALSVGLTPPPGLWAYYSTCYATKEGYGTNSRFKHLPSARAEKFLFQKRDL
jgi:hypothetical protein